MQGLTERQRQILSYINLRIHEQGYPPTIREIGEFMGIRSTNGVNDHLKALERKGYLKREGLKSRALRPVSIQDPDTEDMSATLANGAGGRGGRSAAVLGFDKSNGKAQAGLGSVVPAVMPQGDLIDIPLLGRVAAGAPILADELHESTVRVDSFFLGRSARSPLFALRVTGDSMVDAGIFNGDYIFVKKQIEARANDIVVAMIDGEATVKRFVPERDVVRFVPENASMQPIVVRRQDFRQTSILGVVCGVYRRM
ncbi:MAG: transcriptional repressor LexA [Deltaproteobacteria bacterium]|nr:transcriptional repressor LexA [Deltaproteobacteria bacterium]